MFISETQIQFDSQIWQHLSKTFSFKERYIRGVKFKLVKLTSGQTKINELGQFGQNLKGFLMKGRLILQNETEKINFVQGDGISLCLHAEKKCSILVPQYEHALLLLEELH